MIRKPFDDATDHIGTPFKYRYLFIPSAHAGGVNAKPEVGERTQYFESRADFLAALDTWNRSGGLYWKYWSVS